MTLKGYLLFFFLNKYWRILEDIDADTNISVKRQYLTVIFLLANHRCTIIYQSKNAFTNSLSDQPVNHTFIQSSSSHRTRWWFNRRSTCWAKRCSDFHCNTVNMPLYQVLVFFEAGKLLCGVTRCGPFIQRPFANLV